METSKNTSSIASLYAHRHKPVEHDNQTRPDQCGCEDQNNTANEIEIQPDSDETKTNQGTTQAQ